MKLSPFLGQTAPCPKCQHTGLQAQQHYCESQCIPDNNGGFISVAPVNTPPTTHLHHVCAGCGFERLTECADARASQSFTVGVLNMSTINASAGAPTCVAAGRL